MTTMARNERTVTGTVTEIKRLRNSDFGNPTYRLTVNHGSGWGTYRTRTNASVGYEIHDGLLGRHVTLTLSGQGTVIALATA